MGWAEDNERERIRRMVQSRLDEPGQRAVEAEPFPMLSHTTQSAMSQIAMMMREAIEPAVASGRSLETALREEGYAQANAEQIATEYIVVCISHFKKG
jgi:hypothetical protein